MCCRELKASVKTANAHLHMQIYICNVTITLNAVFKDRLKKDVYTKRPMLNDKKHCMWWMNATFFHFCDRYDTSGDH